MRPALVDKFRKLERTDYGKFTLEEPRLASRADLHAFILLNRLCPSTKDIITASDTERYYLNVDIDKFESIATEDNIRSLVRCGIGYDEDIDALYAYS